MLAVNNSNIKVVPSRDVYNLQLYEIHLIIDTRSKEFFECEHIESAVSLPYCPEFGLTDMLKFLCDYQRNYGTPMKLNPVIIYGNSHIEPFCEQVSNSLGTLLGQSPERYEMSDDLKTWSAQFFEKTKEIWVIENGFNAFRQQFPFAVFPTSLEVPFPLLVDTRVYWGSRNFKVIDKHLQMMNITHVILDSETFDRSRYTIAITLFEANVKQRDSVEQLFRMAADFIEETLDTNNDNVILVNLYGRSTSASILIAWMILKRRISFSKALQQIQNLHSRLDHSQMFLDILQSLEHPKTIKSH